MAGFDYNCVAVTGCQGFSISWSSKGLCFEEESLTQYYHFIMKFLVITHFIEFIITINMFTNMVSV